jgi:hypothetical protein
MTTPPHLLPSPVSFPSRMRPVQALRALADQLQQRGVTQLYGYACERLGVLSLSGVSIWTNGRVLWWRVGTEETTWPAADPDGAARILSRS